MDPDRFPAILMSLLSATATGCGGDLLPGLDGDGGGKPSIRITSPDDGDVVESSSVRVKVDVDGFDLDEDAIGGAPVDGQGHYHYYVDGSAAGEGARKSFLVTRLQPGRHEIGVRLFQNDHQPVPGVPPSSVMVTIPGYAPRLVIVSPDAGASIRSSSVELSVQWENYASGRWQAYVDDLGSDPQSATGDPTTVVTRLEAGPHLVYARLHHSDGRAYEPEVVDVVPVAIPEYAPSIRIVSPLAGESVPRNTPLHVEVKNFDLDAWEAGGDNAPDQGHYHIYIGGYDSTHLWQEGYWPDEVIDHAPAGEREIFVRLMNNDHTSIEPKTVDRVKVTVTN